ncbi:hypothetical protein [Sphaerisporangium corydalis]|uniref:DUF3592 domain-containing protein n=1 Tax=Sphaerisporangium corydalis TaxID=1441875 RepID=A0ABV9ERY6_9ACTN|nr:hypothetical protein [Sphaerisporangium corydalis]
MEERNGCGTGCLVMVVGMLVPLAAMVAMILGLATFAGVRTETRAALRQGTMGSFVAGELKCQGRGPCRWWGSYRSDDGRTIRASVWINGYFMSDLTEGSRVPALDTGHGVVVHRPGYFDAIGPLMFLGFTLIVLFWPGYLLWRLLWKRRRPKPA